MKEKKIEDKDETMKKYMFELHEELRKDMKELKQDLKEYIDKKFDELKNPENQAPGSSKKISEFKRHIVFKSGKMKFLIEGEMHKNWICFEYQA